MAVSSSEGVFPAMYDGKSAAYYHKSQIFFFKKLRPSADTRNRMVRQFGVSEIDCFTKPGAVAPDAGVKLRTTQVAHTRGRSADASVKWMNSSAGLRVVYHFSSELTLASGATALLRN
jgi:hypothetical protein